MTTVSVDFEVPAVEQFSSAERRLLDRLHRRLTKLDRRARVAPQRLLYAAASAVECLRFSRFDALACAEAGGTREEVRRLRDTGRGDALFYMELGRAWIETEERANPLPLRMAG